MVKCMNRTIKHWKQNTKIAAPSVEVLLVENVNLLDSLSEQQSASKLLSNPDFLEKGYLK